MLDFKEFGEIASGRNLNKLIESFCSPSFSVFILDKLFPLCEDGSVQYAQGSSLVM